MIAGRAASQFIARARLNRPDPVTTVVELGTTTAAPANSPKRPLRLVTFNVHAESADAIVHGIHSSRSMSRADLLLLQEMESIASEKESRARQVARRLDMHFAYAPAYARWDGGSHGVAILSRFPLHDIEVIELPRYDVHFNSARRIALGATADTDGGAVRVYSVHLDNRINLSARLHQLDPVLERAERDTGAVIIGGDLNTTPFCWLAHVVPVVCGRQAARVEAAVRIRGYATPAVGVGPTSKWFGMRLDALFTRGLTPVDAAVDRSVQLSDHLPLWVDVEKDSFVSPILTQAAAVRTATATAR
jgi:endonuclease/exonuclease/phosphatase family metal-dependent hydrolase